jgi:hypothetical protein
MTISEMLCCRSLQASLLAARFWAPPADHTESKLAISDRRQAALLRALNSRALSACFADFRVSEESIFALGRNRFLGPESPALGMTADCKELLGGDTTPAGRRNHLFNKT